MISQPQLQQLNISADRDAVLEAARQDGAVTTKGLFTKDQVRRLNEEVQPAVDGINAGCSHTEE
jgi:hypothetical protein